MTQEQMIAEIQALREANAKLIADNTKPTRLANKLSLKVSAEKKCLSIYGVSTRGAHMYASQWLKILEASDDIKKFIEENRSQLAWKNEA